MSVIHPSQLEKKAQAIGGKQDDRVYLDGERLPDGVVNCTGAPVKQVHTPYGSFWRYADWSQVHC